MTTRTNPEPGPRRRSRALVAAWRAVRLVSILGLTVAVLAASLAYAAVQVGHLAGAHTSDHTLLELDRLPERSYVYDRFGGLQATLTNPASPQNRQFVALDEVADQVVAAVVAVEDATFYEHAGVNLRSIGRAADANLEAGEASQGASTITQQVVKNSLVGDEQSITRKLREAMLAVELDRQMSKEEILEYYLNSIYLGGGAYGVQAAAGFYFDEDARALDWAEAALLASLISSPNAYNPFRNPKLARQRRDLALGRLVATGELTEDQAAVYATVPMPTVPHKPTPVDGYLVEEVKQQLLDDSRYGLGATAAARNRTLLEGGIKIFTTYDPFMQAKAEQARNETLPANRGDATFEIVDPKTGVPTFGTQAIASVEPSSGAVRVLVGGPGFDRWKLNLALTRRQPGSTMKSVVLATLFEQGKVPSDRVDGGPCRFRFPGSTDVYAPSTGRGGFGTLTTMATTSSNCGFVRLGQVAGIDRVVATAHALGIAAELDAVPSLPLGTSNVSPLELASAYATLANDGVRHEPYFVERIEAADGKVLYQHAPDPVRAVSVDTARLVTQVLRANVTGGTGTNAQIDGGQPAAGKTGTTNGSTDVWFAGYTPQLATAIWMGAPAGLIGLGANPELAGATGGRYPAATWGRYYSLLFGASPVVEFPEPPETRRGTTLLDIPNEEGGRRPPSPRPRPRPQPRPQPQPQPGPTSPVPPTTPPATVAPAPPPPVPTTTPTPVTSPPVTVPPVDGEDPGP